MISIIDSIPLSSRAAAIFFSLSLLLFPEFSHAIDFDKNWDQDFYVNGLDGRAFCTIEFQGDVIIGGMFTHAGTLRSPGVVGWNPLSRTFFSLGEGIHGSVSAMTIFEDDLVVVGDIIEAGGQPVSRVARWNGESWSAFGEGLPSSARVVAAYDGELYAGQYRWSGEGWDDFWQTPFIDAMTVWDGKLVIGGRFSHIHGEDVGHCCFWDGSSIEPMSQDFPSDVENLQVIQGNLYASCSTSYCLGDCDFVIQKWDGYRWNSMDYPMDEYGGVSWVTLGEFQGQLIVTLRICNDWYCALFSHQLVDVLAPFPLFSWDPFPLFSPSVWLKPNSFLDVGSSLLIAGDFYGSAGEPANNIIEYDGTNSFPLVHDGQGLSKDAVSLCNYDGKLVVGGPFDYAGQVLSSGVASWDGVGWEQMNRVFHQGNLILPGRRDYFQNLVADGQDMYAIFVYYPRWTASYYLCTWNRDLNRWDEITQAVGPLALFDGDVFTVSGGLAYVLQGNEWTPIGGFDGGVVGICSWNGGIVVSGNFSQVDGVPANSIAFWDGSNWSSLGEGFPGTCRTLGVVQGQLVAAVYLGSGNEVRTWNGSQWETLGGTFDGNIKCFQQFGDHLYAGGIFEAVDGQSAGNLAWWDGAAWIPYGTGVAGEIKGMEVFDGKMYLAGEFRNGGNIASSGIACLLQPLDLLSPVEPAQSLQNGLVLEPNYPNPFNPSTTISFSLSESAEVTLRIFDLSGRLVRTLIAGESVPAGQHERRWDGTDNSGRYVPTGEYIFRVEYEDQVETRKAMLLK